jgi:cell division protein FtsQ
MRRTKSGPNEQMTNPAQSSRRSEEIRLRRSSRPRRNASPGLFSRSRKASAPALPPILVRGGLAIDPHQGIKRSKPARRRYDVALSTTGAEVRLPSLPRLNLGWRLVSGLLVGLLIFALYTVWNSPMYQVQAAEVDGLRRLTSSEVNAVLGVAGQPVFTVQPVELRRKLKDAFPELMSVSVDVKMPAAVLVTVEERQPVLAWKHGDQVMWVDALGVAFPPRGDGAGGPSVLVEAESQPPSGDSAFVLQDEAEAIVEAAAQVEAASTGAATRFLPPQLVSGILVMSLHAPQETTLRYSQARGLGWHDSRGWEVFFGANTDNLQMKLIVYEAIVNQFSKEGIQPAMVSVEYVHAPYYRLER